MSAHSHVFACFLSPYFFPQASHMYGKRRLFEFQSIIAFGILPPSIVFRKGDILQDTCAAVFVRLRFRTVYAALRYKIATEYAGSFRRCHAQRRSYVFRVFAAAIYFNALLWLAIFVFRIRQNCSAALQVRFQFCCCFCAFCFCWVFDCFCWACCALFCFCWALPCFCPFCFCWAFC